MKSAKRSSVLTPILSCVLGLALLVLLQGVTSCATTISHASDGLIDRCQVTDGDTIRCGDERIRLLGIDAPELPGHCRRGRICAPGDPFASRASLIAATSDTMRIVRIGRDRYGRTLALIAGKRGHLSCWQLRHGRAVYKPRWDDGGRIASLCPDGIRRTAAGH